MYISTDPTFLDKYFGIESHCAGASDVPQEDSGSSPAAVSVSVKKKLSATFFLNDILRDMPKESNNHNTNPFIVGGHNAQYGQFPWQVSHPSLQYICSHISAIITRLYTVPRGGSRIWQWGAKILSVAHKSVADPGFEVAGGPLF